VTGDESWINHRKIHKKAANASWVAEGESLANAVEKGETIDHRYYIENCLKPLVSEIK
jgi:hypothetical protein